MEKKKTLLIAIVFSLITSQLACKDSQIQKAAKATDDMAVTISLAIDAKRALALTMPPLISPEEEVTVTLALQKVNAAVGAFRIQAMGISKLDPNSKAKLLPLFQGISESITDLNNQGLLGIKNPEAKNKLTLILGGLAASLAIVQSVLMGGA
jgi:hypothetical protein